MNKMHSSVKLNELKVQASLVSTSSYFGGFANLTVLNPIIFDKRRANPFCISYHWMNSNGCVEVWDGIRKEITPKPLNNEFDVSFIIQAPCNAGVYDLQISFVKEGIAWFDDTGEVERKFRIHVVEDSEYLKTAPTFDILIAGGAGFRNAGDEALLRSTVLQCKSLYDFYNLAVAVNDYKVASETLMGVDSTMIPSLRCAFFRNDAHYNACDDIFINRWRIVAEIFNDASVSTVLNRIKCDDRLSFIDKTAATRFAMSLSKSKRIVIHGGGILTSATRSRLWEFCLLARIAKTWNIPYALKSHQFGPYIDEDREMVKELLDSASFVSTRDLSESRDNAISTGVSVFINEEIDDAFNLKVDHARNGEFLRAHGLLADNYICICYRDNPKVGVSSSCFEFFKDVIDKVLVHSGMPIVLLPLGPFDLPVLNALKECSSGRIHVIVPDDWLFDPLAVAQCAHLMISLPHHPLIFSLQCAVPVISIVEGLYYNSKNVSSMRWFGMEENVIDVKSPDSMERFEALLIDILNNNEMHRSTIIKKSSESKSRSQKVREKFSVFLKS